MVQQKKTRSWAHQLREENNALREKIADLRKENRRLGKDLEKAWELMAHVPGGIFLLQRETVAYANEAASRWLGYRLGELAGRNLLDIIDPEDANPILDLIHGKASMPTPDALRFKNRRGKPVYCAVHAKKTRHEGRNALLLNLIEIENKFQDHSLLLEAGKFRVLQNMAGAVAEAFDDEVEDHHSLLETLKGYAKEAYHPSELKPIDMNNLMEETISSYCFANGISYGKASPSDSRILLKSAIDIPSVFHGSEKDLQQAVTGLVANASESIEESGVIYLTAQEGPGIINIYIQENGCGIKEAVAERIFDPFFTTKKGEHKGLGLSLARATVERHGGSISLMRHEAGGATFHVKLPLDPSPLKSPVTPRNNRVKNAHILLMGDQSLLNNLLSRFLLSKGLNITRVESYRVCLRALKNDRFHLILLDHAKTHSKTARVVQRFRKDHPQIPIALYNAVHMETEDDPKSPDPDLEIQKPLHVEKLYKEICRLLSN